MAALTEQARHHGCLATGRLKFLGTISLQSSLQKKGLLLALNRIQAISDISWHEPRFCHTESLAAKHMSFILL